MKGSEPEWANPQNNNSTPKTRTNSQNVFLDQRKIQEIQDNNLLVGYTQFYGIFVLFGQFTAFNIRLAHSGSEPFIYSLLRQSTHAILLL